MQRQPVLLIHTHSCGQFRITNYIHVFDQCKEAKVPWESSYMSISWTHQTIWKFKAKFLQLLQASEFALIAKMFKLPKYCLWATPIVLFQYSLSYCILKVAPPFSFVWYIALQRTFQLPKVYLWLVCHFFDWCPTCLINFGKLLFLSRIVVVP